MANPGLSREVILARLKVYSECGCSVRASRDALRISDSAMRNTLDRARTLGVPIPEPAGQPALPSLESASSTEPLPSPTVLQRLRDRVRHLEAQLREVHRDNVTAEDVRTRIFKLAECEPDPPKWVLEPTKVDSGWMTVPTSIWSDWHLTEVVGLAETNGVNEYDVDVAKRRVRTLVRRIVSLCFEHAAHPHYPGIVIPLIGDIISGGIHPELRETNDGTEMDAVLLAVDVLIWALTELVERFGRLFVLGVPGNHGRNTVKPMAKRYVHRNFDWLICCLLERHFRAIRDDRVSFLIPDSGEALYRVYGWRYLAIHGDDLGVKGGDGIIGSLGPIARGEIKIHHSNSQVGRDYDFLMMGHWHQQFWLPRVIVNNTLKGTCEFARRVLKATPTTPTQSLFHTHPDHGIINRQDVFVDRQVPRQKVEEWRAVFEV